MHTTETAQAIDCNAAITRVVLFFETLTAHSVAEVDRHYAATARFKDPFNDVTGTAAIARIFAHMFQTLSTPRFVVTERIAQGPQGFLCWEFHFSHPRLHQGRPQTIRGASHLVFNAQGQITLHRDYWDAAEELYEKLPVLGSLMRWLRKQAGTA